MDDMIRADSLSVYLGKAKIIDNVSFCVPAGKMCCCVGPNGAGKTTLLRALCALIPFEGSCRLAGADPAGLSPRERARACACLSASDEEELSGTALEIVLTGAWPEAGLAGRITRETRERAEELMEELGIASVRDRGIRTLSDGQRRMVLIARTFLRDVPVIVMDEPDASLDAANRGRVMRYLKNRVSDGKHAVLAAVHDIDSALMYADSLLLLDGGGRLRQEELPAKDVSALEEAFSRLFGETKLIEYGGRLVPVRSE